MAAFGKKIMYAVKNRLRSAGLLAYRSSPPVFGLGLSKTGTTSLGVALKTLGFRHKSYDASLLEKWSRGEVKAVFQAMEGYSTFEDWPYPLMYNEIMQRYGRSARYILTVRTSPTVWLKSLKAHALRSNPDNARYRDMVFGWKYPQLNEKAHLEFYEAHNSAVRAAGIRYRVADLLIEVCWEQNHGWAELCSLLDCRPPRMKFPHANASKLDPVNTPVNRQKIAQLKGSFPNT